MKNGICFPHRNGTGLTISMNAAIPARIASKMTIISIFFETIFTHQSTLRHKHGHTFNTHCGGGNVWRKHFRKLDFKITRKIIILIIPRD